MSIEKLKRVMWRLQELAEDWIKRNGYVPEHLLRKAILEEIGTDEETIRLNIAKLVELGWVKRVQKRRWSMTTSPSEL